MARFKKPNLNKMAKEITLKEGKEVNLSVAQVKEVMHLVFDQLADMPLYEVAMLLVDWGRTPAKAKKAKK